MSNKFQVGDCVILTAPVDGRDDIVGCEGIIKNTRASRPQVYFPNPGCPDAGDTWFCDEDKLIPVEWNPSYRIGSRVRVKRVRSVSGAEALVGLTCEVLALAVPNVWVRFEDDIDLGPDGLGISTNPGKNLWIDISDLESITALPQIKFSFEDLFKAF